jgi:subtilase family serine protease
MKILAAAVVFGLMSLPQALFGQGGVKDRISEAVDASKGTIASGNVHPMARAEFDRGRVDSSLAMRLTITFKMTAAQEADLNALLAAQQDRGSPDYHRWLTPEQFGSRFGLSQNDIDKVTAWLESMGFRVADVPPSRNMIVFTGSAQQVESALNIEIHRYDVNGEQHYGNNSDPSVPAAIADVVLSFRGLNDFRLKPRMLRKETPKFSSGITGNHFITPPDFVTIYDVAPLYQQGLHGEGQKIVVVGQSNININDVRAFRTNSNLPTNDPQIVIVPNESDPGLVSGDVDEASLDVEWAGAIAYNSTVIFVVGNPNNGGVMDAMNYAITSNLAPVISTSYGACESSFSSTEIHTLQNVFQQANAQGITVLAPAGDTGAADCDVNGNPNSPVTTSTMGLAVDLPGALQQVTSVGGTEFSEGADSAGVYWKNPPCVLLNACSSATVSEDVTPGSALSYIPEGAWNDTDITLPGTSTSSGLSAGGGGSSSAIAKPAWQTGPGVPNDGARDVPDISFNASPMHDAYLICSEDINSSTNPATFSPTCVNGFRRNNTQMTLAAVGGTSVGPPAMAGIVALINQATNHAQGSGNINPVLYPLAAHSAAAFHDITSGSNMVPFSPPCVASTQIGYSAGPGYDLATGLGSIDALQLVTNWTSVAPASTANASSSVDFSISFAQSQLTVKRGSCGNGTLVLTRLNGFAGTPQFTCTVAATLGTTTCAIVPAVIGGFDLPGNFRGIRWWEIPTMVMALALVLLSFNHYGSWSGQRRPRLALVPTLAVFAVALMIGCGGSSHSSNGAFDPQVDYMLAVQVPSTAPVATGTASVNAAIGGLSHTAQITLTTQ